MNRDRFQLRMNGHPSGELQQAWNRTGEAGFAFERLVRLKPREEARDFEGRTPL